ncbi:hypothetical protein [Reticulibacter mediterranei]|uniref:hypothetical protein n=1 Tax=Reticulibacter mediterranei TaxID=2778369 RepID=UPI001C68FE8B|nr:hypothetical protein [Reticulibacter mediterranei]
MGVHYIAERRVLLISTRQHPSTDLAAPRQIVETRLQERIVHCVLNDWMSAPEGCGPFRSSSTRLGVHILLEVRLYTEVGPQDRVCASRINEGTVTATALVIYLTRDDQLELLQVYGDWPHMTSKGSKARTETSRSPRPSHHVHS